MRIWLLLLLVAFAPARAGTIVTDVPETLDATGVYVFYLHGRIIENAGPRPTDPRFGVYEYAAVLEALAARGATVISAQRPAGTNMDRYAGLVVSQIEQLIDAGVPPANIVVVGFSKGGGIATRVSSFLRRPEVRFVLLAACPDGPPPAHLRLTGRVLSVIESSDTLGRSCKPLAEMPEKPQSFEEIEISTGKQHGAFYQPHPDWTDPVLKWVHGAADWRPSAETSRETWEPGT